MMSCATLSRKLMDFVHCLTDGLVLSVTFFEGLALVAALETEREKEMQRRSAVDARSSICLYFTANILVLYSIFSIPRIPLFTAPCACRASSRLAMPHFSWAASAAFATAGSLRESTAAPRYYFFVTQCQHRWWPHPGPVCR